MVETFGPAVVLPDVSTGIATDLRATRAMLNGEVARAGGGRITSCLFEYGSSPSYGTAVACVPRDGHRGHIDVRARLRDLTPGTIYHFRLSAGNANGVTHGEDATFQAPIPHSGL
jgi:phosphodiesterase/alkaline phosphatase D-like protein